jgi:hypothetical protein
VTGDKMPGRIALLPQDRHHRPVPWFVAFVNGVPDFRVIRPGGIQIALRHSLCWICGGPFLRQQDRAFTVGSMCCVNRVSAEPPSHKDCAVYSATSCPFLTKPNMVRRERHKPVEAKNPAGIMITRNPGVALVWVTGYKSWTTRSDGQGGLLFDIGDPKEALWFARGREATRDEVLASIDSGLPILREMAQEDGQDALAELERMHEAALRHLPAAAVAGAPGPSEGRAGGSP